MLSRLLELPQKIKIIAAVVVLLLLIMLVLALKSCFSPASSNLNNPLSAATNTSKPLPPLQLQQQDAQLALPFCEKKDCINVHVQSIQTQDEWLNRWVDAKQGLAVQELIGLKQKLSLQESVNAYIDRSDAWQAQVKTNRAYQLGMNTRLAAQRKQYVLLQLGIDAKQEEKTINDRIYFFVADRQQQKQLSLLDVIADNKRNTMHSIVQQGYQSWLKQQSKEVRLQAPNVLYWGQADWFFDQEGIGVHYRAQQISELAPQLDIYLSQAQTQSVLNPSIYTQLFAR